MTTKVWLITLAIANIPIYILLGLCIFGRVSELLTALKYYAVPWWWVYLQGEREEAASYGWKLFFFILLCVGCVFGEYQFLTDFGWITPVAAQ